MNLHLVTDNPVYIDTFIKKVNLFSNEKNYYLLIKKGEIKHIKNVNIIQTDLRGALEFFDNKKPERLYIHYLNKPAIDFINSLPEVINFKIFWFLWGGDAYRLPELSKMLYLPMTKKINKALAPRKGLNKIWDDYKIFIYNKGLERCLKKIDYCCIQVKGDYELVKSTVPYLKMEHKFFAYKGAIRKQLGEKKEDRKDKLDILLGNSANPTNNHIDILDKLAVYESKIASLVCPLSYGGSDDYINEVINFGKQKFGNKFSPLTEFLPIDKYQELMKSIDVSVLYHTRQQGYSNTIMMLEQNKKILMHPQSTLYKMYKDFTIKNVYSDLDQLFNSNLESNENLYKFLGQEVIEMWYKEILN